MESGNSGLPTQFFFFGKPRRDSSRASRSLAATICLTSGGFVLCYVFCFVLCLSFYNFAIFAYADRAAVLMYVSIE